MSIPNTEEGILDDQLLTISENDLEKLLFSKEGTTSTDELLENPVDIGISSSAWATIANTSHEHGVDLEHLEPGERTSTNLTSLDDPHLSAAFLSTGEEDDNYINQTPETYNVSNECTLPPITTILRPDLGTLAFPESAASEINSPLTMNGQEDELKLGILSPSVIQEKPQKCGRKRRSVSDSESLIAQPSPEITTTSSKRPKKPKLYQHPDKSHPKVQRAGYAKSYREKKKTEVESLKLELEDTKTRLEETIRQVRKDQDDIKRKDSYIAQLESNIKQQDLLIKKLKKEVKVQQEKNALNPQQTESILRFIHGIVKAGCPREVTTVNVNISERLGLKKASLKKEKIEAICSEENLKKQSVTFSFDIEENNKLIGEKY